MDQNSPQIEQHFTVLVRLPFNRGEFVDPPPVAWSSAKERELWTVISQPSKGIEINWRMLADKFQVSQQFLLQQAAWLYERQLSQVRAQMRKVGTAPSNPPSPSPVSQAGSTFGAQVMKRTGSGGSRVPSRLSIRQRDSPVLRPEVLNASPMISGSRMNEAQSPSDGQAIGMKRSSREALSRRPTSRPSSSYQKPESPLQSPKSPTLQESSSETSSSEGEDRAPSRRLPPSRYRRGTQPRPQSFIRSTQSDDDDADEDSSPTFLPFATTLPKSQTSQDPGATLRGGLGDPFQPRPGMPRRSTSERIGSTSSSQAPTTTTSNSGDLRVGPPLSTIDSSATSSGSSNAATGPPRRPQVASQQPRTTARTGPLSPRQAAALKAAGLSPRVPRGTQNNPASRDGQVSDGTGTPSMGSSFSDLDDTSVTQSALEEALLSNMQRGGNGNSSNGNGPGVASRMSTISQALRSRYL